MTPVAISRRAGLLLAQICSAFLLTCGHAGAAAHVSGDALAAADANSAPRAGLKASSPVRLADGVFKFDGLPDDPSDAGEAAVAPVDGVIKNDYSLQGSMTKGGTGLFREKGVASWYGKMFHGRKTSSGDPYDMYAMTAAHPSLPIPSYVRVTNLANGRSAVVRVNDRGPFHPGRIIDLSYAAAYKLGYMDQGHASVEVALVLPEDVAFVQPGRPVPPIRRARAPLSQPAVAVAAARPAAVPVAPAAVSEAPRQVVAAAEPLAIAPAVAANPQPRGGDKPTGQVFLQLGAFATPVTAEQFKSFVEHELKWLKESVSVLASEGKYRLHVGPFTSAFEARSMAERIAGTLKLKPFVVQR